MKSIDDTLAFCRVAPGKRIDLKDYDPGWEGDKSIPKSERKRISRETLGNDLEALGRRQELLYASDTWSVLLIFQGMDAAGKDSTIKHVMTGVNPQGVSVTSFKHPSAEELDHDFLWRCEKALPQRGRIGIFNRSYYEDVLIARVHPTLLKAEKVPGDRPVAKIWKERYESICDFERHLVRNGTLVLKFFLHLSKEEQRNRFLDRVNDPAKHWKFSPADLVERGSWGAYQRAFEDALSATSTKWAPWYVIPADHKWVSRALVAAILIDAIEKLDLKYPEITPEVAAEIEAARTTLAND